MAQSVPYVVYNATGGAPYEILSYGSCPTAQVAAQASSWTNDFPSATAEQVSVTTMGTLLRGNPITDEDKIGAARYRFTPGGTLTAQTPAVQNARKGARKMRQAMVLRNLYARRLGSDARYTLTSLKNIAAYLNALDDWIDAANWDAALPALPGISTSATRAIDMIEDPLVQANTSGITTRLKANRMVMRDTTNLVANPSFETDGEGWTGLGQFQRVNGVQVGGLWSLKSDYSGVATGFVARNELHVEAREGEKFYLEGWVRRDVSAAASSAGIRISWLDDTEAEFAVTTVPRSTGALGTFELVSNVLTAPAGTAYARAEIYVYGQTAGAFHWDDVRLHRIDGLNRIEDGTLPNEKIGDDEITEGKFDDASIETALWRKPSFSLAPAVTSGFASGGLMRTRSFAGGWFRWYADGTLEVTSELTLEYNAGYRLGKLWSFNLPAGPSFTSAPLRFTYDIKTHAMTPVINEIGQFEFPSATTTSVQIWANRITGMTNFLALDTMTIRATAFGRWTSDEP